MTNKEIKELLITMFAAGFDIEKLIDINGNLQQSFEFQTGFEYKIKNINGKSFWHDAQITAYGVAYLKQGYDDYHDPVGDGRTVNQGEPNSIESFEIQEIEVFVDSAKPPFMITFDDLNKAMNPEK